MQSTTVCPASAHDRLKRDSQWAFLQPVGIQEVPGNTEAPAYELALANCPLCGSTIAREVPHAA